MDGPEAILFVEHLGYVRMTRSLLSKECEDLYARVHAQNDLAAWKALSLRLTRHFCKMLGRQVGSRIPRILQRRLVEHAINATRRRTRLHRTWDGALSEARGRLARLVLRILTQAHRGSQPPASRTSDREPAELLCAWAADAEMAQHLEHGEVRLLLRIERDGIAFAFLGYDPGPGKRLTGRKREVAKLLGKALGNKGMARSLSLRESTVKGHLQIAYEKAGLSTRAALARYAIAALEDPRPPAS